MLGFRLVTNYCYRGGAAGQVCVGGGVRGHAMTLESLSVSRGGCNEALSDLLFIGALNITTTLVTSPL